MEKESFEKLKEICSKINYLERKSTNSFYDDDRWCECTGGCAHSCAITCLAECSAEGNGYLVPPND